MTDLVLAEDDGHVRHLILNRPDKRNAFNTDLIRALYEAALAAAADNDVWVVVLRGNGKVFSAGVDLMGLGAQANEDGTLNIRPFRRDWMDAVNLLEEMTKPVVASIHGGCFGGALETALACDIRIVTEDARFSLPETQIGLIPDVGGCARLPQIVGVGRAKELILTSRQIDGVEAERIGLANRVVPADQLESATQEMVDQLLRCSPTAVGLAKRVIDASARPTLTNALEMEISLNTIAATSEDFKAGIGAFVQKQPAEWKGR